MRHYYAWYNRFGRLTITSLNGRGHNGYVYLAFPSKKARDVWVEEYEAEQVIAAFVYDDLTECGIEEGLHEAKNRKIGWVVKEDGNPIQSLKELCMWVLSSRFFTEVPTTIIESVDIEEFGIHLLEGNTIFLYDDDKKRVCTHTGQYYIHNNLILYHLGM